MHHIKQWINAIFVAKIVVTCSSIASKQWTCLNHIEYGEYGLRFYFLSLSLFLSQSICLVSTVWKSFWTKSYETTRQMVGEKRHPLHFNVINGFRGNSAVKVKMCCCNAVFWWDFFTMCVCAHARTRSANVLAHQKRRVTPISFAECWIFMVWATRMGFILR